MIDVLKKAQRGLAALALAGAASLLSAGGVAAQEYPVIRPTDVQPEQRIDVRGTMLAITYVENAEQANAVFFQGERDRFHRAADDPMGRPYGLLMTSHVTSEPALIVLDLSWISDAEMHNFVDLAVFGHPSDLTVESIPDQETVRMQLQPQQDGTYLARAFWELSAGSMVNNTDWGVREQYTTRDDSINARVDNGPDDDEARAQGQTPRTGGDD
ncbi:MAG: hypothetical protein AB7P40_12055 [Chloroflexota bacterium]